MGGIDKDVVAFSLKVASTAACGLFAGCSLYINACEVPANLEHSMPHALQNWQRNFYHASHFQPKVHLFAVATAAGHFLLTRGTEKADLPFLMAMLVGELNLPFTLACIMPTNHILEDQDNCKSKGDAFIRKKLETWNVLHACRTALSLGCFVFATYRLPKGPN